MNEKNIIYDIIGVGFGPANIALAIALEEFNFKGNALFLEAKANPVWQENMLFEDSDIQNNPLRDLVTPRNPRSKYTFTNFLHVKGRLFDHLNTGMHFPFRIEFAQYIRWVASHFAKMTQYNTKVVKIEFDQAESGNEKIYKITDLNGQEYFCKTVVVAPGRTPNIPETFQNFKSEKVIHLTQYLKKLREFTQESLKSVAIIGGSQSAIEILLHLSSTYPKAELHGIKRVYGYKQKDVNPFTGEVYYPEFVDFFHSSSLKQKRGLINDLYLTNYSASDADVLDRLYQKIYQQKIQDQQKIFIHRCANVTNVCEKKDGLGLEITKLESENPVMLEVSLVILATGFKNLGEREHEESYPKIIEGILPFIDFGQSDFLQIRQNYSIGIKGETLPTCFLNGLCESSHGMGDAGSFSLLALRAEIIANALFQTLNQNTYKNSINYA